MRQILFILLVFCTYPSDGQIDNYLKYQELINSAELELINNKKEAALDLYCKALLNS
jgi:hypothetical protein